MAKLKPVRHEEQLSLVDHLDELRSRIIFTLISVGLIFAVCFWQSSLILDIASAPLPEANQDLLVLAPTEAFMTTVTVCAYAAVIVSAPLISYQFFAYVLPAFSPRERKAVVPLLITIPLLFLVGVIFAYFVILPAAINFLLNFGGDNFDTELRAREYYSFFSTTLLAGGVVFQMPVIILALVKLRIVTVKQLRSNRRYAYLVIALIAAALPGVDPLSMLIEMVPLLILYELSIFLARGMGRQPKPADEEEPTIEEH
ncbi:MAG: twin-arginine translocase subunit TatC [Thermoleophilia bacterium]|nr:twin-arginine translocase subunit TatC [Thermoleophilia bacterium]